MAAAASLSQKKSKKSKAQKKSKKILSRCRKSFHEREREREREGEKKERKKERERDGKRLAYDSTQNTKPKPSVSSLDATSAMSLLLMPRFSKEVEHEDRPNANVLMCSGTLFIIFWLH